MDRYTQHPLFKYVCSILSFILSWLTLDIDQMVEYLLKILQINDYYSATKFISFLMKFSICLIISMILLFIIAVVDFSVDKVKHRFSNEILTKEFNRVYKYQSKRRNSVKSTDIFIWGYSLSFAAPIQQLIKEHSFDNINVIICLPDEDYMRTQLLEEKPIDVRIAVQQGRIKEWQSLMENHKIDTLHIYRFQSVPFSYGVKINGNIFINYYNWSWESTGKCKQIKTSYESDERKLMLISSRRQPTLYKLLSKYLVTLQVGEK